VSAPVALPPIIPPPATPMQVSTPPVPPSTAAISTVATPSPPVATLDGSQQALAALAAPANASSFAGTVAPGDSAGSLVLVTSFGTFALSSTTPFPIGSQLTLQTIAGTPGGVAVLTIDNAPTVASAPVQTATGPAALPSVPEEAPPTIVDLGTLISATVIAAAPQAIASSDGAPQDTASPVSPGQDPIVAAVPAAAASAAGSSPDRPSPPAPLDARLPTETAAPNPALPGDAEVAGSVIAAGSAKLQTPLSDATAARSDIAVPADSSRAIASIPPQTGATPGPQVAPGPGALPVGTSVLLRVIAVQTVAAPAEAEKLASPGPSAPASANPLPAAATTAPALSGTIRSASPAGAVVETALGALRLTPLPPLSPGTPVAVRLLPGNPATVALTIAAGASPEENGSAPSPPPATSPTPLREPVQASAAAPRDTPRVQAAAPSQIAAAANPAISSSPAPRPTAGDALIARVFIVPPAASSDAPPQAIIGQVLDEADTSPAAPSLVETPQGVLAVSPRLAVPTGSLLLLAMQDAPLIPDALAVGRPSGLERGWPALEATIGAMSQTGPTLATRLINDLSVHGGETLAATLLFLVATLRGSGPPTWPGTAIERALALAGRDDLKQQLGEDIGVLRQIAADPATGHWQVFLLPVHDGTAFRPVRLYLARRDKRAGRGRGDEDKSRFVLEFEMSRIGALQLDGFIRRRRFDLALRSRTPLAPVLRADITRIFHARIAAAGLAGEIEFATVAQFDIAPLDGLRAPVGLAV
jgi:hypothetical protein